MKRQFWKRHSLNIRRIGRAPPDLSQGSIETLTRLFTATSHNKYLGLISLSRIGAWYIKNWQKSNLPSLRVRRPLNTLSPMLLSSLTGVQICSTSIGGMNATKVTRLGITYSTGCTCDTRISV